MRLGTTQRTVTGIGALVVALPLLGLLLDGPGGRLASAQSFSSGLTKYVDPLPIPKVLQPVSGTAGGSASYVVKMKQFQQKLHRDLPPTTLWGYNGMYPGPTIEARTGQPVNVRWVNNLPSTHLLEPAYDTVLHGADRGEPHVRTVVHLHGAHVDADSDGFPEHWFTNNPNAPANGLGGPAGNFDNYRYVNTQQAATLWYHDHALGMTRLNVHTGLAGFYFVRDDVEDALPLPSGQFEIPLMIQDRMMNADGSLLYPLQTAIPTAPYPASFPPVWIPEFFGDTAVVNGKVWPYLKVEPRRYRFRILNGSNARFLNIRLSSGQSFCQIGTDGGLLPAPVRITSLLLAPSERADIVINFKGHEGESIVVTNDALSPYPDGGDAMLPEIMQFRVAKRLSAPDTSRVPASLRPLRRLGPTTTVRDLTLEELDDPDENPVIATLNGMHWTDPATEVPVNDSVEEWRLINLTGDAHPIHVHLVQFRILDRTPFDAEAYEADRALGQLQPLESYFTGPPVPPDPNEAGRKDTVKAYPGFVTRIAQHFKVPAGTHFPAQYVWHCHILEHEDNDMMRPLTILAP